MTAKTAEDLGRLIGRRIRELRYERGWDQIDLEAHLDGAISRSAISYLETGQRMPSIVTIFQLAQAFEIDPSLLFLSPSESKHHAVAIAVLECSEPLLSAVAKLLDVE